MADNEEDLESIPGVGAKTAESFRDNGYGTIMKVATASPGELSADTSVGESNAEDIIQKAQEIADVGGFETGTEIYERRDEIGKLQFQIEELDSLLGGGIETQSITEVYGEFGSGKSQVTHQMAVRVQLPYEYGGLSGSCVFIDSEDTFRPERITEMVRGLDEEVLDAVIEREEVDYSVEEIKDSTTEKGSPARTLAETFLDRIQVAKAFNANHQILLAQNMMDVIDEQKETDWPVRLVCVDSLTAHFRAEYVGRGELAERQQKLNKHMHDILKAARLGNSAAIVTNQVSANPDSFFGDPTQPIGGNILGHTSNFRIYIRKSKENKRIFRLVDAPNLPDGEAVTRITADGVVAE